MGLMIPFLVDSAQQPNLTEIKFQFCSFKPQTKVCCCSAFSAEFDFSGLCLTLKSVKTPRLPALIPLNKPCDTAL